MTWRIVLGHLAQAGLPSCGSDGHALVAPFGKAAVHRAGPVAMGPQQPDRLQRHHAVPAAAVRDNLGAGGQLGQPAACRRRRCRARKAVAAAADRHREPVLGEVAASRNLRYR